MRIAVLSDIHGNYPALQAVAANIATWQPDHVIVNGDVVNRGARPLECLQFVQEQQRASGWKITRGNHEDFVIRCKHPDAARSGPLFEIQKSAFWTYQRLGSLVRVLGTWPEQVTCIGPDGDEVRFTHASMQGNQESIFIDTSVRELRSKIDPPPAVFCTAHTHHAWIRYQDATLVVNSGSVGTPFDGHISASYARLTWHRSHGSFGGWRAEIVRLDYDRKQTELDFAQLDYVAEAGPVARIMYAEWQLARSLWPYWEQQYSESVLAGKIPTDEAVKRFLQDLS